MFCLKIAKTFSIIVLLFFIAVSIYMIHQKEIMRVRYLVKLLRSPITDIHLTLFDTYVKNKRILYIRYFSNDETIIHEITHSLTNDIGHTRAFYDKYFILMKEYYASL